MFAIGLAPEVLLAQGAATYISAETLHITSDIAEILGGVKEFAPVLVAPILHLAHRLWKARTPSDGATEDVD